MKISDFINEFCLHNYQFVLIFFYGVKLSLQIPENEIKIINALEE